MFPATKMKQVLATIFSELGVGKFDVVVDHGCGDGTHYSGMLKAFANEVYGVDILEENAIHHLDQYFQVPTDLRESYFDRVPDNTVDCVTVLSSMGLSPNHDFVANFLYKDSRQGRYFTAGNYPRILKPDGYIVIVEWEARPEKRFGRKTVDFARKHIKQFYPCSEIPGCEVALQGFSHLCNGPYLVYRKSSRRTT